MKVQVYFNLHKKVFSIRSKKTGRVIGHSPVVELKDVTFKVRESGRLRVLAEGRKNVHAYVEGTLVGVYQHTPQFLTQDYMNWEDAYYNPYKVVSFVDAVSWTPLYHADRVVCHNKQISYLPVLVKEESVC